MRRGAKRFEQAWRLADIHAGLPQVYAATSEAFVAQMLNLDLLDGISFSKGCYTGQEIIARTQHLGRIKRRMFRLRLPAGEWSIGQALHLSDGRQGRLTEVIESDGRVEALAVLNVEPTPPAAGEAALNGFGGSGRTAAALSDSDYSGRMCGNSSTSRIEGEFVYSITRRSTPSPKPAAGGMPYSNART